MNDIEAWIKLNRVLHGVQSLVLVALYVACVVIVLIKFRASIAAALVGVAAFLALIVMTLLHAVLPYALEEHFFKVVGFLGFGHVLAVALLLVALVLAPTRKREPGWDAEVLELEE